MADLRLREIPLTLADGTIRRARGEGNNAAWLCPCGVELPLLGRCFPAKHLPRAVCPECGRSYEVRPDLEAIIEVSAGEVKG